MMRGGPVGSALALGMLVLVAAPLAGAVPAAPSDVEAHPGPGTDAVTVTWIADPLAVAYRVYDGDSDRVMAELSPDDDADPWDGRFTFRRGFEVGGMAELGPVKVSGGPTLFFTVSAMGLDGEGPRSARVSTTPFLACANGVLPVCVGTHPQQRLGALVVPQDGTPVGVPTQVELGRLRVEVSGEYAEQTIAYARANEGLGPEGVEGDFGPVSVRYKIEGPVGPQLRMVSDVDGVENDLTVASAWRGRLWVYLGETKLTDVPTIIAIPFGSGPCEETGEECARTPGAGVIALVGTVALVAVALRRKP